MIRMTRRRSSKRTAKNPNSLTKTMRRAQRHVVDEVVDVVGGGEEATAKKTTG